MVKKQENIIFGVNPILEKLRAAPGEIEEILISEPSRRPALMRIRDEATRMGIQLVRAEQRLLDGLAGGERHQGVVARTARFRYLPFIEMIARVSPDSTNERVLILDGLEDPRNLGALLRTAESAGVRYVLIPKDRSVDVTPLVVKSSAGAVYHVEISKVTNLRRAVSDLKKCGYWIAGLDAHSSQTIYERSYPPRLGIVLGSEGSGVRPIVLRECDFVVSIPMVGRVSSLNVSVAGAVFMYELLRQSRQSK